jgi:hypothetical protein
LVVADRKLVVLLSKFFGKYPDQLAAFFADVSISATEIEGEEEEDGDGDSARGAAEASAEAMKVRFAEVDVDDGLDIPASLRRTAP